MGGAVPKGDGILLDGKILYVMQNRLNQIAVVRLNAELSAGDIVAHITDSAFDVPATIAEFGDFLYAVNARFGTPAKPDTIQCPDLSLTLTTPALYQRGLKGVEACSCKPAPRGLPSSLAQLRALYETMRSWRTYLHDP